MEDVGLELAHAELTDDATHAEPPLSASVAAELLRAEPATIDDVIGPPEGADGRRISKRDTLFRRALALADMAAVTIALTLSAVVLGDDRLTLATLAVPLAFVLVVKALGLYDRDEHLLHRATLDEVPALFAIATLAALLLWLSNGLIVDGELGRRQVLGTWGTLFLLLVALRSLARAGALRFASVERCLLVGDTRTGDYLREKLAISPGVKAELVGVIPADGPSRPDRPTTELPHGLGPALAEQAVDRVILAVEGNRDELLYTIRELKSYGVKVSVLPEASRVAGSSVELDHLHGITLQGMRRFEFPRSSRAIKRGFDVIGATAGLLLLAPLLATTWVAIRLDSGGPSLFRQRRVGRHGDEFEMLKFRSMVNQAEQLKEEVRHLNEGAAGLFKIADDPRVTTVGRWLRRWQIDELPQLVNVLRGQMSLVGPRPLIAEEDRKIEGWFRRRLDVPPGITGHWQVLGSSRAIPLHEMVKLDYLYVANWSLWGDVRLLLRTVPFIVRRRGI